MIYQVEVGFLPTNSYFYIDEESLHGFLIDPGAEAEKLLQIISEKNFNFAERNNFAFRTQRTNFSRR